MQLRKEQEMSEASLTGHEGDVKVTRFYQATIECDDCRQVFAATGALAADAEKNLIAYAADQPCAIAWKASA
jgi:hypothetical protein